MYTSKKKEYDGTWQKILSILYFAYSVEGGGGVRDLKVLGMGFGHNGEYKSHYKRKRLKLIQNWDGWKVMYESLAQQIDSKRCRIQWKMQELAWMEWVENITERGWMEEGTRFPPKIVRQSLTQTALRWTIWQEWCAILPWTYPGCWSGPFSHRPPDAWFHESSF